MKSSKKFKFIDIGANLVDNMYQGIYHGTPKHEPDLNDVLKRSEEYGVDKIIITGTCLKTSRQALDMAKDSDSLFTTVGCHPTECNKFEASGNPEMYLRQLRELARTNRKKVVAIGECGLDYYRLEFCKADVQKKYFDKQLDLSTELKLPLFLHCREAADDFINILKNKNRSFQGVVHSFDGNLNSLNTLVDMGFYIGINGCSLRTNENLEVVKSIPRDRLLIETDCPWCEVKSADAGSKYIRTRFPTVKLEKFQNDSLVKSRNEPCKIIQVLEILSAVRGENEETLSAQIYRNTEKLFFSNR